METGLRLITASPLEGEKCLMQLFCCYYTVTIMGYTQELSTPITSLLSTRKRHGVVGKTFRARTSRKTLA